MSELGEEGTEWADEEQQAWGVEAEEQWAEGCGEEEKGMAIGEPCIHIGTP